MRATQHWHLTRLSDLEACITTTQAMLANSRKLIAYAHVLNVDMCDRIERAALLDQDQPPNAGSLPISNNP
jgi:hypothetical protein